MARVSNPWSGARRCRISLLLVSVFACLVLVVLTAGRVHPWFRTHLGDVFIVMAVYLLVLLVRPGASSWRVALGTFAFAVAVECSQLWHLSWLAPFRASFIGRMTIGGAFDPLDIVHYAIGVVLIWLIDVVWFRSAARDTP